MFLFKKKKKKYTCRKSKNEHIFLFTSKHSKFDDFENRHERNRVSETLFKLRGETIEIIRENSSPLAGASRVGYLVIALESGLRLVV